MGKSCFNAFPGDLKHRDHVVAYVSWRINALNLKLLNLLILWCVANLTVDYPHCSQLHTLLANSFCVPDNVLARDLLNQRPGARDQIR